MTEAELQAAILEYIGYLPDVLVYHVYDSRRSNPGFPDLVILGTRGVLWRELKSAKGRTSKDQKTWIAALERAGEDVAVWRPEDWPQRAVEEIRRIR